MLRLLSLIKQFFLLQAKKQNKKSANVLLVYDANIASAPRAWYIFRYFIYEAWPTLSADDYFEVLESMGSEFFQDQGIEQIYFIKPTPNTLLRAEDEKTISADKLEEQLIEQGIHPEVIFN